MTAEIFTTDTTIDYQCQPHHGQGGRSGGILRTAMKDQEQTAEDQSANNVFAHMQRADRAILLTIPYM